MKTFFTSDLHLGHTNIIKYSNRPFQTIEEMDQALIDNWNRVVSGEDVVYVIGDFSFYKDQQKSLDVLKKLNGAEIHLVMGNHDKHMKQFVKDEFTTCSAYKEIYVPDSEASHDKGQFIILAHYAFRVWNKSHHGSWNLYGHSHGSLPDDPHLRSLDVGVDCWNYTPVSYDEIKEKMKLKTPKSVDHHKERNL